MDHLEVIVSEVNEPAHLAVIKCLRLAEVGQVFVIGKDLYQERRAVEVVAPGFQGADDREEFSVVDVVISLGRRE